MKRADRLYALIEILKRGGPHRAEDLARRTGVSMRTVYRDMETLAASGVPVEGARGEGYRASAAITLPPLNLTETELEILHLALAVTGEAVDEDLRAAAISLSAKIEAVLPEEPGAQARFGLATYPFEAAARGFAHMPRLRAAIRARQKLRVRMSGGGGARVVRPLKVDYWGRVWSAVVWDEAAADFATLRLDRIEDLVTIPSLFVDEPGKRLSDFEARP
ncbi:MULTISPECIES: helix-turn-helix transcriptional regulator [unclassified Rhodosalinus]|uniref:helix-turn-helix transcriptional regulator n=1 Tax=unclassified Rhodosalinus TaxID=2630183 RepID=UPI003524691A